MGFEWGWGGGGVEDMIQNQTSPDFSFPEVGISTLTNIFSSKLKICLVLFCLFVWFVLLVSCVAVKCLQKFQENKISCIFYQLSVLGEGLLDRFCKNRGGGK